MNRKRRILINTASNLGFQFIQMATGFFLLPLVLAYFGKEIFGINAYIGSLVLFFNFLAFAISMSLMKYIPEMIAKNEYKQLNDLIFSTLPISAFLHFILGLLIFTFPYYGLNWFNVAENLQPLTKSVMQLVGIFTFLQFFQPIAGGILAGLQRFHLDNKITMITVISSISAYLIVKNTNSDLFYYVLILQIGILAALMIKLFYCIKLLPTKIKWVKPNFQTLKRVSGFNIFLIATQVSDHLMYTADRLILQKLFGPAVVTYYHIARRTQQLSRNFMAMPTSAIIPSLAEGFANKDNNFIRKMNFEGALIYNFITIPPLITLFILLDKFIFLWVGPGYELAVLGGRLFLLSLIVLCFFRIARVSLVAKGRVKEIGYVKFISAILNVFMSYFLAKRIGLIGVIIPTVVFIVFVNSILSCYLVAKEKILALKEIINASLPGIITSVIVITVIATFKESIRIYSWIDIILWGLSIYLFGMIIYFIFTPSAFKKQTINFARKSLKPRIGRHKTSL